jgi:hypothetical protein
MACIADLLTGAAVDLGRRGTHNSRRHPPRGELTMRSHAFRRHYAAEFELDFAIHLVGTLGGAMGATALLTLAAMTDALRSGQFSPTASG